MENSFVDSGETMEMITTEKNEESVKGILREVKSQAIDHGEAPVPETVAPANEGTVSVAEDERFIYKVATFAYSTVYVVCILENGICFLKTILFIIFRNEKCDS